jgi:hypothetical protein
MHASAARSWILLDRRWTMWAPMDDVGTGGEELREARIAARIGEAQACVAAMLLLTMRGTPTSITVTSSVSAASPSAGPGPGLSRAAQ